MRDWGLVFLPDGRVLLFDLHCPIEMSQLLELEPRTSCPWSSLPEPRRLAERIEQIVLELKELPPEESTAESKTSCAGNRRTGTPVEDDAAADPGDIDRGADTDRPDKSGDVNSPSSRPGAGPGSTGEGWGQTIRGWFRATERNLSKWKEKAEWDLLDQSALLRKLVREFREGDPGDGPATRGPDHSF